MNSEDLRAISDLLDKKLDEKLRPINERLTILKEGQGRLEKKLDSVVEQTAYLTEFKTNVVSKFEEVKEIKEVTKQNCFDIAKLKAINQ